MSNRQDKINAAKRTIQTLHNALDFDLWAADHENEEAGLDRLLDDIENFDVWQKNNQKSKGVPLSDSEHG